MTVAESLPMSTSAGLQLLAAGEGEQPADQLGALLGGVAGHADDLRLLLVQRQPPLDHAEPAEHRGEQIVEIVRDAAGQLADRVHLAGLEQLFSSSCVGDVEQGAGIPPAAVGRSSTAWSRKCLYWPSAHASDIRSPSRRSRARERLSALAVVG